METPTSNKESLWFVDDHDDIAVDVNDISCARKVVDADLYHLILKNGERVRLGKYTYMKLIRFIRENKGNKNGND